MVSGASAFAVLPEGANFGDRATSAWTEVKKKVTQTVKDVKQWWEQWNGDDKQAPEKKVAGKPAPKALPVPQNPQYAEPVMNPADSDSTLQDVQQAKSSLKKSRSYEISEKGRPADPNLKVNTKGVPYVSQAEIKKFANVKSIPLLDVGREDRVSKADFTLPKLNWAAQSPKDLKPLPSAEVLNAADLKAALGGKFMIAGGERKLEAHFQPVGKVITLAQMKDFSWPQTEVKEVAEKPYKPLSPEEINMVAALILFSKGTHCHMVMGLMSELAQKEQTKYEALYHLGACADQLKMNEAAFKAFAEILKSPKHEEYASEALELLAVDLHKDAEKDFYQVVKKVNDWESLLTDKSRGPAYYRMAKGAFKSKHFNRTWQFATKVPETSDYWPDAQLLASIGYFNAGKKKTAIDKLSALNDDLDKKGYANNNIKALVKADLARMKFLHGNVDQAIPLYLSVPKDHGLWVQALIEQGWAQIHMDDYLGAVGNMYSLHSPYFKVVYQPESFVVRTIGYLNICQYGDAYKTLSQLEKEYRGWYGELGGYLQSHGKPADVYSTVKTYLQGKSTQDVQNVAYQILREAARSRDFLNAQSALNEKTDELVRYEGVNKKIKEEKASIRSHERAAKKRFDVQRGNVVKAMKDKELAKKMDEFKKLMKFEKELVIGYRFQLAILEQSRQGYLKFQDVSQKEVNQTKDDLKLQASEDLLARMKEMKDQMARVLDNNEFLRYEVFAGSGENIRYQVAGGKTSGEQRVPASIKPAKSLNWSFDGEFWEDEIGNYRSSLRSNCPQDQAMLSKGDNQ
jgi:hypothetical protein